MINNAPFPDDDLSAVQLEAFDEAIRHGQFPGTVANERRTDSDQSLRELVNVLQMLDRAYRPDHGAAGQEPATPTKIGRFLIERILGYGGFGTVFLATDPLLRRQVAIKVPRVPCFLEPTQRQRFLREGQAAAALSHPNLIPIFEAGESAGVLFLAVEYAEGPTLNEWLRSQSNELQGNPHKTAGSPVPGGVDLRQAAEIVRQLAEAVEHAHRHGILHRDIKPRNVILDQRHPGPKLPFTPRLTDFGLAKMMEMSCDQNTLSGTVLGTPEYMSPEQAAGEISQIGPATDVYGLGVLMYELLTGQTPFRGESPAQTICQVLEQSLTLPSRLNLNSKIPQCLDEVCLRCLQRDPKLRYASAGELAKELSRVLDQDRDSVLWKAIASQSTNATMVRSRFQLGNFGEFLTGWKPISRNYWRGIDFGIALSLIILAAFWGFWSLPGREINKPSDQARSQPSSSLPSASQDPLQDIAIELRANDLDVTFGVGGIVRTDFFASHTSNPLPRDIAVQADGKYVVVGDFLDVIRYHADGEIDDSFGYGGGAFCHGSPYAVAIQADGKIVVGGTCKRRGKKNDYWVDRYNVNGSLDTSFDEDGQVMTDFNGSHDVICDLTIQPHDGKILVAGYSIISKGQTDFSLARYNPDGTLDSTFDGDGRLTDSLSSDTDHIRGVALDSQGRIVAVGDMERGGDSDYALVRYLPDGTRDGSFGSGGIVLDDDVGIRQGFYSVAIDDNDQIVAVGSTRAGATEDIEIRRYRVNGSLDFAFRVPLDSSADVPAKVAIQPDGKILVAGTSQGDFAAIRLVSTGKLDPDFAGDGIETITLGGPADEAHSLAVQSDGKIVLLGERDNNAGGHVAMIQLHANGGLNSLFGTGGMTFTAWRSNDGAFDVAVQSDGKLVVVGKSDNGTNVAAAIVRYNADGTLDTTFDHDGKSAFRIGPTSDCLNAVAIQADGKIVAAGQSYNGSNNDFAVSRFNADGTLDSMFGGDGVVTTDILGPLDIANAVAIQADGKIVVGGTARNNGINELVAVRYNADGTLDNTFSGNGILRIVSRAEGGFLAIQPDDRKIVIGGTVHNSATQDFFLFRMNEDGSTDLSPGPLLRLPLPSTLNDLVLQSDGKTIAVGQTHNGSNQDFLVARFNADGTLDTSFSEDGKVIIPIGDSDDIATSVALHADGRIVVSGYCMVESLPDFAVIQLKTDGSLDNSFSGDGKAISAISANSSFRYVGPNVRLAIQANGNVLVAGHVWNGNDFDIVLVRFQPSSQPGGQ